MPKDSESGRDPQDLAEQFLGASCVAEAAKTSKAEQSSPEDRDAVEAADRRSAYEHLLREDSEDSVGISDLLSADIWKSTFPEDSARQRVGQEFYSKLNRAFEREHPDADINVSGIAGIALALGVDGPDEFGILVNRKAIRFKWTEPNRLLISINELAEEVRRWIPDDGERHGLLTRLFGIASEVLVAAGRANESIPFEHGEPVDPPDSLAADLESVEPQIQTTRDQFLEDAQRAAQQRYATGMAWGALALLVLSSSAGLIFLNWDVRAIDGVGLFAGGIGACVSVLRRMTSGALVLNFQTMGKLLTAFGALRPLVGGVFGQVTFCVLDAGLISAIHLPTDASARLSFVVVFAFAAGFNERFFQDMLATASQADGLREEASAVSASEALKDS